MATFSVHFDGPITTDHKVSLRVLSKTYAHMQRALDRAYLLDHHGEVWKHARLKDDEYEESEFLAEYPREGGIILDAVKAGGERLVDLVHQAVRPIFALAAEEGIHQHQTIGAQLEARREYARRMGANTQHFQSLIDQPRPAWADAYSNRSIVKEIAQLVGMITPDRLDGSIVTLDLTGNRPYASLEFTGELARRFNARVSEKEVAQAFILEVNIRDLNRGNKYSRPKAKVLNLITNREVVLHLESDRDFLELHPFHTAERVNIFVAPMM
ncbi:MAG: hypothetical protein KGO01_05665, partial [Burkholderiales bacterium]|nr:hypothetical protein [Burkholderiales bacterium]